MYINRGRFGEFVKSVVDEHNKCLQEEIEKDNDWKLWTMYIHLATMGLTKESFADWKERICKPVATKGKGNKDADLDEDGIRAIMDDLFPS